MAEDDDFEAAAREALALAEREFGRDLHLLDRASPSARCAVAQRAIDEVMD